MSRMNLKKKIKYTGILFTGLFVFAEFFAKKKRPDSIYKDNPKQQNNFEGKKVIFVENENDKENADGVKGHLKIVGESKINQGIYEKYIKRFIDIMLSFAGLMVLSPVMGLIALCIYVEDPGPVIFIQKRVGQNKRYFKLHKFRSMKMNTPHDIPTHQLKNPEQYITKTGNFIRAHSLDELPQIWDIFIGNMSIVGPRPALWNQDLLVSERDKYGANDVKPGLTGLAQINGRDELEIPDKARLDGKYCENLGFIEDVKIFLGSLHVLKKDDTLVEGGTGQIKIGRNYLEGKTEKQIIGNIGFGEKVEIDKKLDKKVLITGAGSYIGEAFKEYAKKYTALNIDVEDTVSDEWKTKDFSGYDIVYHVAGIAHADTGNVNNELKEKYYKVNTDLAIEVCKKAKKEGVKEFVFMSSMIVYGPSAPYGNERIIGANTMPTPENFYGDSKLQADVAVRALADDTFKVMVLRPPMIYGKNSKGNYPKLSKLARIVPVFPKVDNERSMLYIENLCEFLCQIMSISNIENIKYNDIVLLPQNTEWVNTSHMVEEISTINRKNSYKGINKVVIEIRCLRYLVLLGSKVPGKVGLLVNKAFGNCCYEHSISNYEGINYQVVDFIESIYKTENNEENDRK